VALGTLGGAAALALATASEAASAAPLVDGVPGGTAGAAEEEAFEEREEGTKLLPLPDALPEPPPPPEVLLRRATGEPLAIFKPFLSLRPLEVCPEVTKFTPSLLSPSAAATSTSTQRSTALLAAAPASLVMGQAKW
jgi:hypothetical protein